MPRIDLESIQDIVRSADPEGLIQKKTNSSPSSNHCPPQISPRNSFTSS